MGHSLGGRVAMLFATLYPWMVPSLVVVDMAAKDSPPFHQQVIVTLWTVDLRSSERRNEAEKAIAGKVENRTMRTFPLANLMRKPDGGLKWQVPLDVLQEYMPLISANPLSPEADFSGSASSCGAACPAISLTEIRRISVSTFPNIRSRRSETQDTSCTRKIETPL